MKMILLTSKQAGLPTVFAGALAHGPDELSVTVSDLSPRDMHDARKDPKVIGAAPPMPMYMIQGIDSKPQAMPKVSWGVEAVGAARAEQPNQPAITGAGVTMAVLDTGIDKNHPAFKDVELVTENFTGEAEEDEIGHGTHCAGRSSGVTWMACG